MFIRGGFNVYPAENEVLLAQGGLGLRRAARPRGPTHARRAARLRGARELQAARRAHRACYRSRQCSRSIGGPYAPPGSALQRCLRAARRDSARRAVANPPLTLSLIIPAYNQRERSIRAAATAMDFLQARFGERAELIMVDDGSVRGKALEPGDVPGPVPLIRHPQTLGKGVALRSGVARARGEYAVLTDSDLPFSLEPLPTTLDWLREGADIVIGDRCHPESMAAIEVTASRRLSSVVYTWAVNRLLALDYPDIQCGYKGYRAAAAKDLFGRLEVTSFAFEAEILVRAHKACCPPATRRAGTSATSRATRPTSSTSSRPRSSWWRSRS